jgi:hypothetical protein
MPSTTLLVILVSLAIPIVFGNAVMFFLTPTIPIHILLGIVITVLGAFLVYYGAMLWRTLLSLN